MLVLGEREWERRYGIHLTLEREEEGALIKRCARPVLITVCR